MKNHTFTFECNAKPFSILHLKEPHIVYSLVDSSAQTARIEFVANVNCTLVIGDDIFYCGPAKKFLTLGEIVILDKNSLQIGWVDYEGWIFQKKRIYIRNADADEEWTLKEYSIFTREFWTSRRKTVLENGEKSITLEVLERNVTTRILGANTTHKKIRVSFSPTCEGNFLLLCGLIIYMHERMELDLRG